MICSSADHVTPNGNKQHYLINSSDLPTDFNITFSFKANDTGENTYTNTRPVIISALIHYKLDEEDYQFLELFNISLKNLTSSYVYNIEYSSKDGLLY